MNYVLWCLFLDQSFDLKHPHCGRYYNLLVRSVIDVCVRVGINISIVSKSTWNILSPIHLTRISISTLNCCHWSSQWNPENQQLTKHEKIIIIGHIAYNLELSGSMNSLCSTPDLGMSSIMTAQLQVWWLNRWWTEW